MESKDRACTGPTFDFDCSPVLFKRLAHDNQAQSGAGFAGGSDCLLCLESLKEMGQLLRRNANAGVGNFHTRTTWF